MPDDVAAAEVAVWVQAHGDDAAAVLVEALPRAGETGRAMAFRALVHIGPDVADEVARLRDRGVVR